MSIPKELLYTKDHEWCSVEDDIATVGITYHAQEQLGDIVYIELPAEGDEVSKDEAFGLIESPKAVSDLFSPLSGRVAEINETVKETPNLVNEDPYEEGWLIRVELSEIGDLEDLMSAEQYGEFILGED
ncbi:MAG: glycine cleavage system protein GcvH [bacterium]